MQNYSIRDKVKATHKRRAKAVGAAGTFDKYDVSIRLGKQNFLCHYCLQPLILHGPGKYQIDHFIPLSRGGSNYANNLVIA
ncbi:HNH endonuclease, partial [Deinococcus ruber]|uniref:HNH endonuclease n=1 Tax=Deinococcus ruber TaxID=1848197 RepID=UPI0016678FFB